MAEFSINDLAHLASFPADLVAELDANNNYLYLGMGKPGAAITEPHWQIKKFTIAADGKTPIGGRFADGDPTFCKVWTDRADYTYLETS